MGYVIDKTGVRYGRLVVVSEAGRNLRGKRQWNCDCDCGNVVVVLGNAMQQGRTTSCGCLRVETARKAIEVQRPKATAASTTHGATRTREFNSWQAMKSRCLNPNYPEFGYWGGRGISIDPRWMRFENFLADMGPRPPGTTLDRINNDGNYEPGNCRWGTAVEQAQNQRAKRFTR